MSSPPPSWNDSDFATWYIEHLDAGSPAHDTALQALLDPLPAIQGLRVLDIGCGQGLATRALAARKARVIGIDLSHHLLEEARRIESASPLGIRYEEGDAQLLTHFSASSFDVVTASLALPNFGDIHQTFKTVKRVLVAGGSFVFTIPHPCFETPFAGWVTNDDGRQARTVNRYFHEIFWRSPEPWRVRRVGNYHRTLSTYVNSLVETGHHIAKVVESGPGTEISRVDPGYEEVAIFISVLTHV